MAAPINAADIPTTTPISGSGLLVNQCDRGPYDEPCCGNGVVPCFCGVEVNACGISWNCPAVIATRIVEGVDAVMFESGTNGAVYDLHPGTYTLQCQEEFDGPWKRVRTFTIGVCPDSCCQSLDLKPITLTIDFAGGQNACSTLVYPGSSTPLDVFNGTYVLTGAQTGPFEFPRQTCLYSLRIGLSSWSFFFQAYLDIQIQIDEDSIRVRMNLTWPGFGVGSPAGCVVGPYSFTAVSGCNELCALGYYLPCLSVDYPDVFVYIS
jgi:hypothetical protein